MHYPKKEKQYLWLLHDAEIEINSALAFCGGVSWEQSLDISIHISISHCKVAKNVNVRDKRTRAWKGVRQCFLFPFFFPVIFHSTLLLLLRTLSSSLKKASPVGIHPIESHLLTLNTQVLHTMQTKTLMVSATQAPIKFKDKDSCFIY